MTQLLTDLVQITVEHAIKISGAIALWAVFMLCCFVYDVVKDHWPW